MDDFSIPSPRSAGLDLFRSPLESANFTFLENFDPRNVDPALLAGSNDAPSAAPTSGHHQDTSTEQQEMTQGFRAAFNDTSDGFGSNDMITPVTLGNMSALLGQIPTNSEAAIRHDPLEEVREYIDNDTTMVNPFEPQENGTNGYDATAFRDVAWTSNFGMNTQGMGFEPQQQHWEDQNNNMYSEPQYTNSSPYQRYGLAQNADSSYGQPLFEQPSSFNTIPCAAPYSSMTDSLASTRDSWPASFQRASLSADSPSGSRSPSTSPQRSVAARKKSTYRAEKPKKDGEKPWIRTNASTKGESTRTGKINEYDPEKDGLYRATQHPIGDWTGPRSKQRFVYNKEGELRTHKYTVEQIEDFLYSHATNKNSALTLWIQKTPADCARRYPTQDSSKCCFADCPAKYEHRNILVGHMRVAFDEQWLIHGVTRDPFKVAGYVHLYCLERFCDFPYICRILNVQPDNREFPSEPRGVWGASLGDGRMHQLVKEFISACQYPNDAMFPQSFWQHYPHYPMLVNRINSQRRGDDAPAFEPLPFNQTLTFALTDAKLRETNNSKRRMMERRGLNDTNILVHVGDLQKLMNAKLKEKERRKSQQHKSATRKVQKRVAARRQEEEEEEEAESSGLSDINEDEAPKPAPRRPARKAAGTGARKVWQQQSDEEMADAPSRKRSRAVEADSGDENDEDFQPESRQKRRRTVTQPAGSAPVASMPGTRPGSVTDGAFSSRRADLDESLYSFSGERQKIPDFDATLYF